MPIYEFQCNACEVQFEELVRSSRDEVRCPSCNGDSLTRLLSAAAIKSGGRGGGMSAASSSRAGCGGCSGGSCGGCKH